MSDEERVNQMIRSLAEGFHRPPDAPRDQMWERIQALRAARPHRRGPRLTVRWLAWGVGLAATLALGVAIGRFTASDAPIEVAVLPPDTGVEVMTAGATAYRLAAAEHLGRVETFLTVFSSEAVAGRVADADFEMPARQLLRRTRLLRESPVAEDVVLRALLDDVEFVLLQIASFAQVGNERELRFVEQGINERSVMLRLRSAVPDVSQRVIAEGAL
jgi:hypothetical protein